jgi:predicted unusual protein kinase regulating ubiquinone biosynthesis (AarF/ABC1/UbiB family)
LTLEYLEGTKVTDLEAIERRNISRGKVAEILMRMYLKMILEDGFFHADPHPGNLFVLPGPVVVLLDFGMVGEISPQMRENIRRVFLGVLKRDFDEVLAALSRLGFLTATANRQALKRSLIWAVDSFYEMSFGELRDVNPSDVLNQLQDVLYAEAFQIPANFAFLGRALGTLSGLCTALDPSFRFVSVAEPFGRALVREQQGRWGLAAQLAGEARTLAQAAYAFPVLTRDALQRVQRGELDLRDHLAEVTRAVDRLERVMRRMLYALLVTGFLVAGAFVFPSHYTQFSLGSFVVAMILLVFVLFPFRRRR